MKALERSLGLPSVIAVSIGAMLGSGIFVLPGLAAAKTGSSVWMAYALSGLFVFPAAFSKAELATGMPMSGGTYIYMDRAFGPLAGTISGMGLWLSLLLKSSFALVGLSAYLYAFSDLPLKPTAVVLLSAIALLNIVGVKKVGKAQVAVVSISLVGLVGLVVAGIPSYGSAPLENPFSHGTSGFIAAMAFVYVSYAGVTKIAAVAEEVKQPEKNIPLGILLSLGLVTILYGLVVFAMVSVLSVEGLSGDLRPVHSLGLAVGGPVVGTIAAILGILTLTSMANAGVLAASRFPFAMSRDMLLPRKLQAVHSRFLTPVISILLTVGLMAFAIVFLDIEKIVKLASAFIIMAYVAENASVIILREINAGWYDPPYRSPLYPWLQVVGVLVGLVLLIMLGWISLAAVGAMGLPGVALYWLYGRSRTERTGVVSKLSHRQDLLQPEQPSSAAHTEPDEAPVVVLLLGRERSSETLIEGAAALANGRPVEVVHVSEVPEQTVLGSTGGTNGSMVALKRRIHWMAEKQEFDVQFSSIISSDVVKTIRETVDQLNCEWLVMEWSGSAGLGLSPFNPLGWLAQHLPCNVARFRYGGVRYVRSILVYAEPGPHDALVTVTADHLASTYAASITLVRFVPNSASDEEVESQLSYLEQLRELCEAPVECSVVRGSAENGALVEASAAHDLLVLTGRPEAGALRGQLGTKVDRIISRVSCSVLELRTPRIQMHRAYDPERVKGESEPFQLSGLVEEGCVCARIRETRKGPLFNRLAQHMALVLGDVTAAEVEQALWARERSQNTAIGGGVAIPHAALPTAKRSYLGVFTTEKPCDYRAPGGQGVDVFFMILGPAAERQVHINLLSNLAKLLLETTLLERLRSAADDHEIMDAIREHAIEDVELNPAEPVPSSPPVVDQAQA